MRSVRPIKTKDVLPLGMHGTLHGDCLVLIIRSEISPFRVCTQRILRYTLYLRLMWSCRKGLGDLGLKWKQLLEGLKLFQFHIWNGYSGSYNFNRFLYRCAIRWADRILKAPIQVITSSGNSSARSRWNKDKCTIYKFNAHKNVSFGTNCVRHLVSGPTIMDVNLLCFKWNDLITDLVFTSFFEKFISKPLDASKDEVRQLPPVYSQSVPQSPTQLPHDESKGLFIPLWTNSV